MTEFEKMVAEMRKAQREFFRTRDYSYLTLSKKLEKQVDQHLEELDNGQNLFAEKFDEKSCYGSVGIVG